MEKKGPSAEDSEECAAKRPILITGPHTHTHTYYTCTSSARLGMQLAGPSLETRRKRKRRCSAAAGFSCVGVALPPWASLSLYLANAADLRPLVLFPSERSLSMTSSLPTLSPPRARRYVYIGMGRRRERERAHPHRRGSPERARAIILRTRGRAILFPPLPSFALMPSSRWTDFYPRAFHALISQGEPAQRPQKKALCCFSNHRLSRVCTPACGYSWYILLSRLLLSLLRSRSPPAAFRPRVRLKFRQSDVLCECRLPRRVYRHTVK